MLKIPNPIIHLAVTLKKRKTKQLFAQLVQTLEQKVVSFVSTNACESTFSTINTIKRKQRNQLSDAHLECLARIAVTNYKNNMEKVQEMHLPLIPVLK